MIDLEAERAAARERYEKRRAADLLDVQARRLRLEGDMTEAAARRLWPEMSEADCRRVVARSREQLQEIRMSQKRRAAEGVMHRTEIVELGAELFRARPHLSSDASYDELVRLHGAERMCARSSWVATHAGAARRAAGIASSGPRKMSAKNAATRKKAIARKKRADHPWSKKAAVGVAEGKAKQRATSPEEKEAPDEAATLEEERPGEAGMVGTGTAEPVASPDPVEGHVGPPQKGSESSTGPWFSDVVTSAPPEAPAAPRPIVVVHPSMLGTEVERRLVAGGYIVIPAEHPDNVRLITPTPMLVSPEAVLAAAARAITETYDGDVRTKFGRNVAEAILAGRDAA